MVWVVEALTGILVAIEVQRIVLVEVEVDWEAVSV